MRWLKNLRNRRIHKNNLEVAQTIGVIFTNKLAKDKQFQRFIRSKYPAFERRINQELVKIKDPK